MTYSPTKECRQMATYPVITTRAKGLGALKLYYAIFEEDLPRKFPARVTDWADDAQYDAPHGIVVIWRNREWEVTFSFRSVQVSEPGAGADLDPQKLAEALRQAIPNATVTVG